MAKENKNFRDLEGGGKSGAEVNLCARYVHDSSGYDWKMERMRVGQGVAEGIHLLPNEHSGNDFSWNRAFVPGDVYTDLYEAAEIDDPYFGRNMAKTKWVQDYEWWYTHSFNVPVEQKGKHFTLVFEGVDYSCDVWFNTKYMGRHEGMYSSFSFDVTDLIDFNQPHAPCNKILIKLDPPPKNQINFAGLKHNFAGDYLTGVIPFGIWKPIKCYATQDVKIDNYRIETKVNGKNADVSFDLDVSGMLYDTQELTAKFTLNDGENDYACTAPIKVNKGKGNKTSANVTVENAKLWWPYELGDSFLHTLKVEVLRGETVLDELTEKVGLREVTMTMNPGYTLEEVENPWTFNVNGKAMFLRSACWTQPSFFYGRNNEKKYRYFLEKAKECGINNFRMFGWHPPETEDFYAICDELGITVWTNFAFATQIFRDDAPYVKQVCDECAEIVKDRRNHPSTIMWMGGEEVYFTEEHVKSNNRRLMETLGKVTNTLTNVPYADASPLSSREGIRMGYKPKESSHANSHYYAAGAIMMEDYYPNLDYAVIPELTAASAPNIESLKKWIPENELWPFGPTWGYHWTDIHCLRNLNFEVMGDTCLDSLENFVLATQIAQGTVAQFSLEHFRREKPHCSAVSLCHFITNWPTAKWELIDYYGVEKFSYKMVKKTYQPLIPSLKYAKRRYLPGETFEGDLYVINDYYKEFKNVTYSYEVISNKAKNNSPVVNYFNREEVLAQKGEIKVNIDENSSKSFGKINWKVEGEVGETFIVKVCLTDEDGAILADNEYTIMIADQEKSIEDARKLYLDMHEVRKTYGKSYHRYAPEWIDRT